MAGEIQDLGGQRGRTSLADAYRLTDGVDDKADVSRYGRGPNAFGGFVSETELIEESEYGRELESVVLEGGPRRVHQKKIVNISACALEAVVASREQVSLWDST